MFNSVNTSNTQPRFGRMLVLAISVLSMLMLAGCISSAKVYNNDKNVVYKGTMYNLANVQEINAVITGTLDGDKEVKLNNADRKQIEAYLDQSSSMFVKMAYEFDSREMVYRANTVKKWSDYSKMKKSFEKAGNQITKLMADKKQIQLKLK